MFAFDSDTEVFQNFLFVFVRVDKKRDKLERKVLDSQERAFWDVHRPAVCLCFFTVIVLCLCFMSLFYMTLFYICFFHC